MTEPSITVSGPGGEYTMPHNVDTATYADACDRAAGVFKAERDLLQERIGNALELLDGLLSLEEGDTSG